MNATTDGTILDYLSTTGLDRVYSLRQDFSSAFNQILHSAAHTPVTIELTDRHLPVVMRNRNLTVASAKLVLRTPPGQTAGSVAIKVNRTTASGFTKDTSLGGLYSTDVTSAFAACLLGPLVLEVQAAGNLGVTTPPAGDPSVFDDAKLLDTMVYMELKLA
jgi:hypothetical protein